MNKLIFITALLSSSIISLSSFRSIQIDKTPCTQENSIAPFATVKMTFITTFENDLKSMNVGHMVSVPCDKLETFRFMLEHDGLTSSVQIEVSEGRQEMFFNNSNYGTSELSIDQLEEYFTESFNEKTESVVVKVVVDVSLNNAVIKLSIASDNLMKKLEEYGVPYDYSNQTYMLNDEMKNDLKARLEEKRNQNVQEMVLTQAQREQFMKKLLNGNTNFTQVDSDGENVQFKIVTKIVTEKQNN